VLLFGSIIFVVYICSRKFNFKIEKKMKKLCMLLAMMSLASTFTFTSCSKDDDVIENDNKFGEYVLTVTQEGDVEKYSINSVITSDSKDLSGIFDESGNKKGDGITYTLDPVEAKRKSYTYRTSKDGVSITLATHFTPESENIESPLIVTATIYYNNKKIGSEVLTKSGETHLVSSLKMK
jgi:hypothetical protein